MASYTLMAVPTTRCSNGKEYFFKSLATLNLPNEHGFIVKVEGLEETVQDLYELSMPTEITVSRDEHGMWVLQCCKTNP